MHVWTRSRPALLSKKASFMLLFNIKKRKTYICVNGEFFILVLQRYLPEIDQQFTVKVLSLLVLQKYYPTARPC